MSKLVRVSSRAMHMSAVRTARGPLTFDGWYARDHKPGKYPETEEERVQAALKYGMRPEDYRPIHYDDVNRHVGDYPYLGIVTFDHKDPYESWSDRHHRRNWGEMMPKQYSFDYYRAWPYNDPRKYPIVNYSFEPLD